MLAAVVGLSRCGEPLRWARDYRGSARRSPQRVELDLAISERDESVYIARVERAYGAAMQLDVLLRNKRSPRLQRWFQRDVLPQPFELLHEASG